MEHQKHEISLSDSNSHSFVGVPEKISCTAMKTYCFSRFWTRDLDAYLRIHTRITLVPSSSEMRRDCVRVECMR